MKVAIGIFDSKTLICTYYKDRSSILPATFFRFSVFFRNFAADF